MSHLVRTVGIAYYGDHKVFMEPYLNKDTIETTGAGDTFLVPVHFMQYLNMV